MIEPAHFVYIMAPTKAQRPVKVGISNDPWKRLASVQTGSPIKLEVVEIYGCESRDEATALERKFHDHHRAVRLSGEWFNITADDANYWLFCDQVVWPE